MRNVIVGLFIATSLTWAFARVARAQILPENRAQQSDAGTENLYDQYENKESKLEKKQQQQWSAEKSQSTLENYQPKKLSELVNLAPFTDIAVIQRRYLPKTGRFEISGSGLISTNNAFFNDIGFNARLAYYFNEKYGIEGVYSFLSSSNRPITQGLINNQSIGTQSLVEPKGFYGVTFKWSPVYGKMAWFQQQIIPFDIYFTPGIGMTQTSNDSGDTTLMLGVGQLFSLSKSFGIRWDFDWNYYSSNVSTISGGTTSTSHSDLFLGVGVSYFFPEATYR